MRAGNPAAKIKSRPEGSQGGQDRQWQQDQDGFEDGDAAGGIHGGESGWSPLPPSMRWSYWQAMGASTMDW